MSEAQSRGAGGFVRATGVFLSGLRDRVRLPAARHAGVGSGSAPKEVGRNSALLADVNTGGAEQKLAAQSRGRGKQEGEGLVWAFGLHGPSFDPK